MEKLTTQGEEVVIYTWELRSCYVEDIVVKSEQPVPPYTTAISIAKNLERRKYAEAQCVGNTYLYTPAIKKNECKRGFMSGVVRNYFENSYRGMVSFFAKDQKIPANDLKEIIDTIEKERENWSLMPWKT